MKREDVAPSTDEGTPLDTSTLLLGKVTELTKDLNIFDPRFDIWLIGQWWPNPPEGGV
jgi:hypothetical protein